MVEIEMTEEARRMLRGNLKAVHKEISKISLALAEEMEAPVKRVKLFMEQELDGSDTLMLRMLVRGSWRQVDELQGRIMAAMADWACRQSRRRGDLVGSGYMVIVDLAKDGYDPNMDLEVGS